MGHSKIEIRKIDTGYCFEIFPGNNHKQPLGISSVYPTHAECAQAMRQFHNLVMEHNLQEEDGQFIKVSCRESDSKKYDIKYYDEQGNEILRHPRGYNNKRECKNGICRIYRCVLEN